MSNVYPRISARRGQLVNLDIEFYNSGVLTDPYAIRKVEIYKTQVLQHNLVTSINVSDLGTNYPFPIYREYEMSSQGACCTEPTADTVPVTGKYYLPFLIPNDFPVPDVYFDVWYYFAEDPCGASGTVDATNCDIDSAEYAPYLLKCCKNFWVYPDEWACGNNLQTIRFAFEPLDQKFYQPEYRPLEIGLMPLPLYDYNYNLVTPMIPFLKPTITIETQYNELLIDSEPCRIGLRHGSFRSNPWVIQYDIDTTKFLKGTYRYFINLQLPSGGSRASRKFIFTVV